MPKSIITILTPALLVLHCNTIVGFVPLIRPLTSQLQPKNEPVTLPVNQNNVFAQLGNDKVKQQLLDNLLIGPVNNNQGAPSNLWTSVSGNNLNARPDGNGLGVVYTGQDSYPVNLSASTVNVSKNSGFAQNPNTNRVFTSANSNILANNNSAVYSNGNVEGKSELALLVDYNNGRWAYTINTSGGHTLAMNNWSNGATFNMPTPPNITFSNNVSWQPGFSVTKINNELIFRSTPAKGPSAWNSQ